MAKLLLQPHQIHWYAVVIYKIYIFLCQHCGLAWASRGIACFELRHAIYWHTYSLWATINCWAQSHCVRELFILMLDYPDRTLMFEPDFLRLLTHLHALTLVIRLLFLFCFSLALIYLRIIIDTTQIRWKHEYWLNKIHH